MPKLATLMLTGIFSLSLIAPAYAFQKEVNRFIKCKTVNGTVIVVQGNSCPSGSYYIGEA